jgi:hypothetical protein
MLSKCANPECTEAFHYFGQGRLFEVHFEDAELCEKAGRVPFALEIKKQDKSVEHYWLCPNCSGKLTVAMDRQNNVFILPRPIDQGLPPARPVSPPLYRRAAAS